MTKTGTPEASIIHNETPDDNYSYSYYSYVSAAPGAARIKSRKPVQLTMCPKCDRNQVRTTTRTHPSGVTWALVGVTAIVFWPICWLPLVSDGCKQTDHYCQECGEKVGKIKALFNT
jgi:hypothetical protein